MAFLGMHKMDQLVLPCRRVVLPTTSLPALPLGSRFAHDNKPPLNTKPKKVYAKCGHV